MNSNNEDDIDDIDNVDDNDIDHDNDNNNNNNVIQLGFCISIQSNEQYNYIGHRITEYNIWDGGQLGGYPSWLNPIYIPKNNIKCKCCNTIMNFICQLYTPIDPITDNNNNQYTINHNNAFHRTLYVFVCPYASSSFISSSSEQQQPQHKQQHTPSNSVRILRCQLPEKNEYWYKEPTPTTIEQNSSTTTDSELTTMIKNHDNIIQQKINYCIVCGFIAKGKCPLQNVYFCNKKHQILYKKYVYDNLKLTKTKTNDNNNSISNNIITTSSSYITIQNICTLLPNLYNCMEIVVEEEPSSSSSQKEDEEHYNNNKNSATMFPSKLTNNNKNNNNNNNNKKKSMKRINDSTNENEINDNTNDTNDNNDDDSNDNDDSYDSDEDIEQDDLNEIVNGQKSTRTKTDPIHEKFIDRITQRYNCKNQVIRYQRWKKEKPQNNDNDNDDDDNDDNNNGPLWMHRDFRPTNDDNDIPKCPYCHSIRKFEFQIMPQMLHYMTNYYNNNENNKNNTSSIITNEMKHAIEQTNQIIDNTSPELISPDLIDLQKKAIENVQNRLLNNKNNEQQSKQQTLQWGVIAVYTCINSCCSNNRNNNRINTKEDAVIDNVVTEISAIDDTDDCCNNHNNNNHDDDDPCDNEDLGDYLEEFAWFQPAI